MEPKLRRAVTDVIGTLAVYTTILLLLWGLLSVIGTPPNRLAMVLGYIGGLIATFTIHKSTRQPFVYVFKHLFLNKNVLLISRIDDRITTKYDDGTEKIDTTEGLKTEAIMSGRNSFSRKSKRSKRKKSSLSENPLD